MTLHQALLAFLPRTAKRALVDPTNASKLPEERVHAFRVVGAAAVAARRRLFGCSHQSVLHRMAMHVAQLLRVLVLAPLKRKLPRGSVVPYRDGVEFLDIASGVETSGYFQTSSGRCVWDVPDAAPRVVLALRTARVARPATRCVDVRVRRTPDNSPAFQRRVRLPARNRIP